MGEVVIRLDGRMLERLAYWIIILVLAVLLVFSYLGNDGDTTKEPVVAEEPEPEVLAPAEESEPEPDVPSIDETCSDGIKNQDETAVDCGGTCASINGEYWYNNQCNDEPEEAELSGSVEFSVTNVNDDRAPGDGTTALKVKSFQVKITNGEERNSFPTVTAYVKSTSGIYLNQFGDTYDDYTPYLGPFDIGKVAQKGRSLVHQRSS